MLKASSARNSESATPAMPRFHLRGWLRRSALILGLLILCGSGLLLVPRPLSGIVTSHAQPSAEPFADYVARRQMQSRAEGVRPGNEEQVVWENAQAPNTRAPVVLLYVHGFGASRAEGEATVAPIAETLHATTYYTRLPGHGGDLEHHAAARPEQYFDLLEEDFHRLRPLGEKLVLIGSSTGGLLVAWLAARHPAEVDAVVLASPLIEMATPGAFLLSRWLGLPVVEAVLGKFRDAGWGSNPEGRKQPGYEDFWITRQRMSALGIVEDVRRQALREAPPANILAPILLVYYYADAQHQDNVCSVSAMIRFVMQTHHGSPHPQSRSIAIADGNHILLSRYVRTDKATITRELQSFLTSVLSTPAAL